MPVLRQFRLYRSRALDLLNELEDHGDLVSSIYLPPELAEADTRELMEKALPKQEITAEIIKLTLASPTGAAIFWGISRKLLVLPPFPLIEQYISPNTDVEPIRSMLENTCNIALILVRLGAFAIGVCQGEKLITSKTGTGLVHGRHRKGGSSQRRFERRREKQAHEFLERVCGHAKQQLEPYSSEISYLVYGGAWTTIQSLKKQCSFLEEYEDRTLRPLLNIPRPRRSVLEAAITDVWSSTIIEWYDDEVAEI